MSLDKSIAKNEATTTNDITDIDLSVTAKKRFRINGDNNKILYLNTSDMSIMTRFRETYPKLAQLAQDATEKLAEAINSDNAKKKLDDVADVLSEINNKMCEYMDYIFDSNVSEICSDGGSMYDPFNGHFRFQHIFEKLFELYSDNISKEYKKLSNHIKRHTDKYVKGIK